MTVKFVIAGATPADPFFVGFEEPLLVTVKGTLTAYTGPASGTSGTLTVQPLDPETMEPSSEPAVTIDCDDVEELTIP